MAKKRPLVRNYKDLERYVIKPQQKDYSIFKKEEEKLLSQLLQARDKHNHESEIEILNLLGTLNRKNGKYEKAIYYFDQVLRLKGDDRIFDRFDAIFFTGKTEENDFLSNQLSELDSIGSMIQLGRYHRYKGNYNHSINCIKKVLDRNPNNKQAVKEFDISCQCRLNYENAIAYQKKGDYQKAIYWFGKILDLNPKDKKTMDNLGIAYRKRSEYEKSIEWFEKELDVYPHNEQALNGLKITYANMGAIPQAIQHFKKCLYINPKDTFSREHLEKNSDKFQQEGKLEEAQKIISLLQNVATETTPKQEESLAEKAKM